jgi:hypothetical protein
VYFPENLTGNALRRALHVLLNCSTETKNCLPIGKAALSALLAIGKNKKRPDVHREFAFGVLTNISKDVGCQKRMFRLKLNRTQKDFAQTSKNRMMNSQQSDFGDLKAMAPESETEVRSKFDSWMATSFQMSEGVKGTFNGDRSGLLTATSSWDAWDEPEDISEELGIRRRSMRQPITSLWATSQGEKVPSGNDTQLSSPTLPAPWSHRIGPPGQLGSEPTEHGQGQDRWNPRLHGTRAGVFCGVKDEKAETCILEPGGRRNELSFRGDDTPAPQKNRVVSLCRFRYVEGSKIGEMFPVFELNGKQLYHLYHASRIASEVLDPGNVPTPWPPDATLDHLSRIRELPSLSSPLLPLQYIIPIPHAPRSPKINKHYMPGLNTWSILAKQFPVSKIFGGSLGYGQLPVSSICFMVEENKKEEPTEVVETKEKPVWTLDVSVFAPRKFKEHSKQYFNTKRINRSALNKDWSRLETLGRFQALMARICGEGPKAAENAAEVKRVFAQHYDVLMAIYDYYSAVGGDLQPFTMGLQSYMIMGVDCEFVDGSRLTHAEFCNIFVAVNVEEGGATLENKVRECEILAMVALM